jgi:hypothetical protein
MKRIPVLIGLATLAIAATVALIRSKDGDVPLRTRPVQRKIAITSPSAESPVREEQPPPDIERQVAAHFGLTDKDRRADPTFRSVFLKYGEIRAANRLESYRRIYEVTQEQADRLRLKLEGAEQAHAEAEWARFDAIRRDAMARPGGDVKAAIEEAWKRHASGDPSIGRVEEIRRAKERMDAWDQLLLSVFDQHQAEMLRDVKSKNADWMTDPDRHASVISDLGDMFRARGLELTRSHLKAVARAVKSHAARHPAILGSLPFETHGFPVGLIDWSDTTLQGELALLLPPDRYAVIAALGAAD